MHKVVIADTSCLIVLSKINELEILQKLYGNIVTTTEIALEYGEQLPTWIEISDAKDKIRQKFLETQIDIGESSAIALASEIEDCLLILDDNKARKIAKSLGIKITGTFGVLIKAKENGIFMSMKEMLEKIKQTNFRISEKLEMEILIASNEL